MGVGSVPSGGLLPIRPDTMPRRGRSAPSGLHHPQDHVDVTVKALYDRERIYFLYQWADPDVSAKRFPVLTLPRVAGLANQPGER